MASKSEKPETPAALRHEETVLVGRVLRPHGLRGDVKIEVLSDVPERFDAGRELWLVARDESRRRLRIDASRPVGGSALRRTALLRFEGLATRDDAESLRGGRLEVGIAEVPEAPEGAVYQYQLIGCRCSDEALGEVGEVVEVLEDGGGDILELRQADGRSLLVPFVDAFLVEVDVEARHIELRLPPGLVESCTSRS